MKRILRRDIARFCAQTILFKILLLLMHWGVYVTFYAI